jgi:hypothetical protein
MRRIHLYGLFGLLMFGFLIQPALGFNHGHAKFDDILKAVVTVDGPKSQVRYASLKENPQILNQYVREIEGVTLTQFKQWSESQQIAFLINAYNALTIKLILSEYPDLSSIKDLGGFFSGPWKVEFFKLFGKKRHLDYIEHGLLRKQYNEPRIHFALVCASIGCPALRADAFVPEHLNSQLNDAMKRFLRDKDRNYFNPKTDTLEISSIFKWFKGDFVKTAGSVEAFIAPWITDDIHLRLRMRNQEIYINYLDYDWNLNDVK